MNTYENLNVFEIPFLVLKMFQFYFENSKLLLEIYLFRDIIHSKVKKYIKIYLYKYHKCKIKNFKNNIYALKKLHN